MQANFCSESVAEYTGRPLLSITAADLGHEPEPLERNLLRFFRNARKWNAIVLLDEADVYLETRSSQDLRRNSIVSSKLNPNFVDGPRQDEFSPIYSFPSSP